MIAEYPNFGGPHLNSSTCSRLAEIAEFFNMQKAFHLLNSFRPVLVLATSISKIMQYTRTLAQGISKIIVKKKVMKNQFCYM